MPKGTTEGLTNLTRCFPLSISLWSSGGLSKTNWAWSEPGRKNFCCNVNIWVNDSPMRETRTHTHRILIQVLYLYPPPPPLLYKFIYVSPFVASSSNHLTSDWLDGFIFLFVYESSPCRSHSCLRLSILFLPSLSFAQTAPVSVGESCMIQQYPTHPSHSLLISLSLFLLLVIRGHVWLWILLALRVLHLSSHTSKNNVVNAFMFWEQIWFTSPLCLWIKHGSGCKRGRGGSTWHNEV